jgi:hypothetical protein
MAPMAVLMAIIVWIGLYPQAVINTARPGLIYVESAVQEKAASREREDGVNTPAAVSPPVPGKEFRTVIEQCILPERQVLRHREGGRHDDP